MRSALALLLLTTSAIAADWHDGEWAERPADCGTPAAWRLADGILAGDELVCEAGIVHRRGVDLLLQGKCDRGQGATPESVIVTRRGERLEIRWGDGSRLEGLRRCR